MSEEPVRASGYELPTYPFVQPPELRGEAAQRYPVVIVGGGLTGLTAACDLAVRGVRSVLLDDDNTVGVRGASSRGMVYAQKTLEIMQRLGVYERMREKGVVWSVGRTMAGDEEVYSFDRGAETASCQPAFLNLQQFYLEWFLVDRIMALGLTDVARPCRRPRADFRRRRLAAGPGRPQGFPVNQEKVP